MHATTPRALVVGYGRMGGFHAKVLRDLGYTVTTVDPDPARGADHPTIAEALLTTSPARDDLFAAAAIATPAEHLVESAFQLAGTRMLVEKPFASTLREAAMLAAYLKQAGKPVAVGFVERFNPVVRALRARRGEMCVTGARFVRWNDRPSADPLLDLRLHDIDLVRHLTLHHLFHEDTLEFDTRDNTATETNLRPRRREIEIRYQPHGAKVAEGWTDTFDLMAHDQSPLHALWHAFLTDAEYPTPDDAVRALGVVEQMREQEKVAG